MTLCAQGWGLSSWFLGVCWSMVGTGSGVGGAQRAKGSHLETAGKKREINYTTLQILGKKLQPSLYLALLNSGGTRFVRWRRVSLQTLKTMGRKQPHSTYKSQLQSSIGLRAMCCRSALTHVRYVKNMLEFSGVSFASQGKYESWVMNHNLPDLNFTSNLNSLCGLKQAIPLHPQLQYNNAI